MCHRSVCLVIASLMIAGCNGESPVASRELPAVYVDVETGQPVTAPASRSAPVVNPATGRRTLMPALYCARCARWRAVPPLDEFQRSPQARRCAQCQSALTDDGPRPQP